MKAKLVAFVGKYWREIGVGAMFLVLWIGVSEAQDTAERAFRSALSAANYASDAYDAARDAERSAQEAASYASYCEYLTY